MHLQEREVSQLLNLSEATVRDLVQRGDIRGFWLEDRYCFSREEVEEWVLKQSFPSTENKELEPQGSLRYSLFRAIHKGGVLYNVPGTNKEEILQYVADQLSGPLNLDAAIISEMLLDREKLSPTTLGNGVAVPHTREAVLQPHRDFVAIVFLKTPLLWGASDDQPVDTLFFLFASDDTRHLNLLSKIARFANDEKCRELLNQKDLRKPALLTHVKNWEAEANS